MNNQRPGMFMPALVGGAVAGVLTAVPILGCFCCLWIIGGAMLAAHLLAKNSSLSLTPGDGAIVGIFTGIVAAVVDAVVSIPFDALNQEFLRRFMNQLSEFVEEMPSGWETWLERGFSPAWFLFGLVFSALVFAILGALGGVIGASLFGKKKAPPAQGVRDETVQNPGDRQS